MKSFIILCGGMSRRMGRDKGTMSFHGKPMITHIIDTITPIADEIILVLRDDDQSETYKTIIDELKLSNKNDLIICTDVIKDQGPLAGILTGLLHISSDNAMVIPCDSPFVSEQFINRMFELSERSDYDAFVPKWPDKRFEPLHSIYKKNIQPIIEKLLNENIRDVKTLLTKLNVKYVDIKYLDASGQSFCNMNQPGDVIKFND